MKTWLDYSSRVNQATVKVYSFAFIGRRRTHTLNTSRYFRRDEECQESGRPLGVTDGKLQGDRPLLTEFTTSYSRLIPFSDRNLWITTCLVDKFVYRVYVVSLMVVKDKLNKWGGGVLFGSRSTSRPWQVRNERDEFPVSVLHHGRWIAPCRPGLDPFTIVLTSPPLSKSNVRP